MLSQNVIARVREQINNPADPRRSFSAPPRVSFSRSVSQESDDSTPPTPDMKPSFSRTNTERTIFLDSVGLKVYREALIHADDVDKVEDFHKVSYVSFSLPPAHVVFDVFVFCCFCCRFFSGYEINFESLGDERR